MPTPPSPKSAANGANAARSTRPRTSSGETLPKLPRAQLACRQLRPYRRITNHLADLVARYQAVDFFGSLQGLAQHPRPTGAPCSSVAWPKRASLRPRHRGIRAPQSPIQQNYRSNPFSSFNLKKIRLLPLSQTKPPQAPTEPIFPSLRRPVRSRPRLANPQDPRSTAAPPSMNSVAPKPSTTKCRPNPFSSFNPKKTRLLPTSATKPPQAPPDHLPSPRSGKHRPRSTAPNQLY
jgi:hypothetical protein